MTQQMTRPVEYIERPEFVGPFDGPPTEVEWTKVLEPGDVIFARSVGGLVSTLIQENDGFFTHSALYVGTDSKGVGWIAHSHALGVQLWTLDDVRDYYKDGAIGWARTGYSTEAKASAVKEARKFAKEPNGDPLNPYDYRDLGLLFAILVRSQWRRFRNSVQEISEEAMEELLDASERVADELDPNEFEPATCSAFVWRAFAEGETRSEIVPTLTEGVIVENGRARLVEPEAKFASEKGLVGDSLRKKWASLKIIAQAIPGAAALLDPEKGGLIREVVTPGDMWCSPSMVERGRLL